MALTAVIRGLLTVVQAVIAHDMGDAQAIILEDR
jgi:hypothetical protein